MFVANLIRQINRFLPDWNAPITNKHGGVSGYIVKYFIIKKNLLEFKSNNYMLK